MRQYLIFGGECSKDFGLYISGSGAFNAPERDIETVEVPGRNGSLIIDNGRYKNVTQSYPAFVCRDFPANANAVRAWLLAEPGYQRLEDTYNPDHFRLARYAGTLDFDVRALCRGAETTIAFDCKPQRYLKLGEHKITITVNTTIKNPTRYPALPQITVYGSGAGTITVGGETVTITNIDGYLTLDSEIQNAYKDKQNKNSTVKLSEFPVFAPGETEITFSGGVTKIEIIPRWWTL